MIKSPLIWSNMKYFSKIKECDANVGRPVGCVTLTCSRVWCMWKLACFNMYTTQILLFKSFCVLRNCNNNCLVICQLLCKSGVASVHKFWEIILELSKLSRSTISPHSYVKEDPGPTYHFSVSDIRGQVIK